MHLVLPNHLREGKAKLGRAHRAGHREQHLSTVGEQLLPSFGRVNESGCVEMTIMVPQVG